MGKKKKFVSQEYSAEKGGKNLKEGTKRSRMTTAFAGTLFSISLIIGILLISFSIVFFFSEVKGTSMMRTLNAESIDTDSVIVNRYEKPQRGDIIVIKHYYDNGNFKELHIKRLIALGGESICFVDEGNHYEIQIDGIPFENLCTIPTINGNNAEPIQFYKSYYEYQESGELTGTLSASRFNDQGFRETYTGADGNPVNFRQWVDTRNRWEIVLPKDYFFYMGDNRGGTGIGPGIYNDTSRMSIDSTYFGPQPNSCIIGVVTEIIHDKTAPQWFWSKIGWFFTFKWV